MCVGEHGPGGSQSEVCSVTLFYFLEQDLSRNLDLA